MTKVQEDAILYVFNKCTMFTSNYDGYIIDASNISHRIEKGDYFVVKGTDFENELVYIGLFYFRKLKVGGKTELIDESFYLNVKYFFELLDNAKVDGGKL